MIPLTGENPHRTLTAEDTTQEIFDRMLGAAITAELKRDGWKWQTTDRLHRRVEPVDLALHRAATLKIDSFLEGAQNKINRLRRAKSGAVTGVGRPAPVEGCPGPYESTRMP